ncbi:acyl-CoA carboxylase subunit epsilon [Acidipropionibacterium timonense]|uniref:acyl-CoA carboxylase subunit epsilon n=1 Tax=Acidipropionibacterium timonense TaxID=2161818 RepID=UPI0010302359|nr:acyl-CoA carboxylase subunit epsilon [Acidipropionibacterium timonense]
MDTQPTEAGVDAAPAVQIVKGHLSDEELGALVAVLAAVTQPVGAPHAPDSVIAFGWKSYWRPIREIFMPGQAAWRGSLRRY